MQMRPLGRSGLSTAPIVLGGNVFGWTADEAMSFKLLDGFVGAGFNFIDTADVYSKWVTGHKGGESETIIGKWLKAGGRRKQVVIATKVGLDMGEGRVGLAPQRIREAVEASLRRLQVDCIDLYQAHKDDEGTPLEATLETFARLVEAGKVRAIGAVMAGRAICHAIATCPGVASCARAAASSASRIRSPRGFRYFLVVLAPRALFAASAGLRYLPVRKPAASA